MAKIGRNDLCTCGSGKKYKKCCGKSNVLSMELLIEKELHEMQLDIFHYAMKNYEEEIEGYLEEWYEDIPDEAMEMFHFFASTWFITSVDVDGKTILDEYIDRHIQKYTRPRIKDILRKWRNATPSVSIIQHQDENQYITVQDIFTNEVQKVKELGEEHIVEAGGLVLGTILPVGETSVFFTTFIDIPADESEELKDAVMKLYENSGEESPADFMAGYYLEVLELFMFGKPGSSIEDLVWNSPKHKEVAENFQFRMEDYGADEIIMNLGVYLWNLYCMRRNPTIKKSEVYEAALVYLLDHLHPFGRVTQKELAEQFNVSSSSISSKYKDLEMVLSEEIEDLRNKIQSSVFE
jgi:uncharacterized protein YecA (UPF0149 family)